MDMETNVPLESFLVEATAALKKFGVTHADFNVHVAAGSIQFTLPIPQGTAKEKALNQAVRELLK